MDGERWTARGGWTIQAVVHDGAPCYQVTRRGFVIAYCAGLEELAERLNLFGLDLGDLVEDDPECELALTPVGSAEACL